MSTGATIAIVAGLGAAGFLYFRSQQQQQAALAVAAAQQQATGGGGGGVGGLAGRLFTQWKQDPLGIANTKAVASGALGVVKTGLSQAASLPSDIIGGIRSIF